MSCKLSLLPSFLCSGKLTVTVIIMFPQVQDMTSEEDKMNILVQLFWICIAILESDYEHEFILGLRHIY